MLDKQLCAAFGIDEFNQWIMKQLDYIEDQLYASEISSPRYIELKAKHQTLKDVRDVYWALNQNNLKETIKASENKKLETPTAKEVSEPNTYLFEITIFDHQDDPSRFYKLTHHFEYLCPLDDYPEVCIYGVDVNFFVCKFGYKVIITGQISGQEAQEALAAVDLTDWGHASLVSIRMTKVTKNN